MEEKVKKFFSEIFVNTCQLPTNKWMSLKMVSPGNANLQGQLPTPKWMSL